MKLFSLNYFLLAIVAVSCMANVSEAAPFVPAGVAPGGTYQLVFVTSGARDSTSTLIADYNTYVNNQAAQNPVLTGTNMGVQYFAIGSTTTVNANANAAVTGPVYNFNGDKVADNFADMWDGSLDNAIRYDEFASLATFPDLWTGTTTAGIGFVGNELGTSSPRAGIAFASTSIWISDAIGPSSVDFAFYGLSQTLTAPVPEPSTLIALIGSAAVLLFRRNRLTDKNLISSTRAGSSMGHCCEPVVHQRRS